MCDYPTQHKQNTGRETLDGEFRTMSKSPMERRTAFRAPTSIKATASSSQGARQDVEISDLSTDGCAVATARHPLASGGAYGLKISGLEILGVRTAWTSGNLAGLMFDRPLHVAVADHISARHPRPAEQEPGAAQDAEPCC